MFYQWLADVGPMLAANVGPMDMPKCYLGSDRIISCIFGDFCAQLNYAELEHSFLEEIMLSPIKNNS